jgi:hypothetical protein
MQFRGVIAVYFENLAEHIIALQTRVQFFILK